jgi:hypothetical protein
MITNNALSGRLLMAIGLAIPAVLTAGIAAHADSMTPAKTPINVGGSVPTTSRIAQPAQGDKTPQPVQVGASCPACISGCSTQFQDRQRGRTDRPVIGPNSRR